MSITLYEMAHSPFCIPISTILTACSVDFARVEVPNWDRRELLTLTAGEYYQVPVLVHDQRVIYESGAATQDVARYVDKAFAGGTLFPERLEGIQAIVLDFIENELEDRTFKLVDPPYLAQISDPAIRGMIIRHKERKFGRGCVRQWSRNAEELRSEAEGLLQRFDRMLQFSDYLFGPTPVYADFALAGILGNLTFKNFNPLPDQAALKSWFQRIKAYRA